MGGSFKSSCIALIHRLHSSCSPRRKEYEANKEIYEQFVTNTTVSDQFIDALGKVQYQLTQERLQQSGGSMSAITGDCQSSMSSSMGSDSSYMADQFSDYILGQNDYTLSNGDHVKFPILTIMYMRELTGMFM